MIFALRTDNPTAELYLLDEAGSVVAQEAWEANRELAHYLLSRVEAFLAKQNKNFADIDGLVVYKGPGSFTGLRIGITVMNTWAYSENIPIAGETGDDWLENGNKRLQNEIKPTGVVPLYGNEPRITQPKK